MARRPTTTSSDDAMSSFVTGYLTAGAEQWSPSSPGMREEHYQPYVVYSPNPEQDSTYAQGISPRYDFDHSDHILDQPARLQLYPVNDYERAYLPMENWSQSWNPSSHGYWHWAQSQFPDSSQLFQQPENLDYVLPAHAIGSQDPISDQLIRQHHFVYHTNSGPPAQQPSSGRSRGGRTPGTHLPEETANNSQGVREVGSCLRCWVHKSQCSPYDPCDQCSTKKNGRKWIGCFRSFSRLGNSIIPSILADRLHLESYNNWRMAHIRRTGQETFPLPLSFGFGKVFEGFRGCEFAPLTKESTYSYSVRARRGETQCLLGLPIFVTFESGKPPPVTGLLKEWLRETLGDEESMNQWRRACFPGDQDKWVWKLLETVWEYSRRCWGEGNNNSQYQQINETLLYAWGMTLLATILSLQITVPPDRLDDVVKMLRPSQYTYTNSSRQINRGVKCVIFHTYQHMQQHVMSRLDDIVKNSKTLNGREWGNMYCVSILLIVIINHAQLSLRANYALAEQDQRDKRVERDLRGEWEQTKTHLEDSEAAFRTIAHSFAFLFRSRANTDDDPIASCLLSILNHIRHEYRKDVNKYRTQKLDSNMNTATWFSTVNRLRLFAYFFHAMYPKMPAPTPTQTAK